MSDISTIRTDIHTAFNNIIAVNSATKITSTNVQASYNNRQCIKEGYPQVIIKESTMPTQRLTIGGTGSDTTSIYKIPFRIPIDIHHNSAANVKSVADEVYNAILLGKERLRSTYNLYDINFDEDSIQVVVYTQKSTNHIYTLNVTGLFMDTK